MSDGAMVNGQTLLRDARDWLRQRLDEGAKCPCCTQMARIYRRRVNAGMAHSLILMYRKAGKDWIHLPTEIPARSREEGKLAYWGLAEEATERRDDGGRAGWWRVTERGEQFVLNKITISRWACIYDGRFLRYEGELVSIKDALGAKFDYQLLMAGIP
jgi:hypothetical protein